MKHILATATLLLTFPGFVPIAAAAPAADEPSIPETVISSDRLEMENDGEKAFFLFSDHVKLTGNNLIVTCDRLEIHADRTGDLEANVGQIGSIRQILALGNVSISQEGRVATAGRAEVLPGQDKIVLTESPMVTDTQGTVSGERITFFRGDRRAIVEGGATGPARVILPALPNLGFDNNVVEPPAPSEAQPDTGDAPGTGGINEAPVTGTEET
jgi:lipopolysaccharide transport protein LptA